MAKGSSRVPSKGPRAKEEKQKSQSLGYPVLEEMIEEEDAKISSFDASRHALTELSRKSKEPEIKAQARHALLAYERFQHFFEEMIRLREKLMVQAEAEAEQSKEKPLSEKKKKK
jgi:hypothetical protein